MDLTVTLLLCALAAGAEQSLSPFLGIKSPDCGVLSISGNLGRVGGRHFPFPPLVQSRLAESPSFSYRVSSFSLLYF